MNATGRNVIGEDNRSMPSETDPTGLCSYKVVLVSNGRECTAYRGQGTTQWVMDYGETLYKLDDVKQYFPFIENDLKRLNLVYAHDV